MRQVRNAPEDELDDRIDQDIDGGTCDGGPCDNGGGMGGPSGGNAGVAETFAYGDPASPSHRWVCDVIDWYTNGVYSWTEVLWCFQEAIA